MPRFKEYTAPDKAFSEDSAGYSAFETAGRRVGPLYNAAGQDLRQAGEAGVRAARVSEALAGDQVRQAEENQRVTRDEGKQRISNLTWPYDMLALQQGSGSSRSSRGGGGGMRLAGSVNPEINNRDGGYANDSSGGRGSSPARMSHAAAGLGQLASGLARSAPYAARTDITNGQITYDSRNPRAYQQPRSYLEGGQLVHQGQRPTRGSFGLTQGEQQELDRYGRQQQSAGPIDPGTGTPDAQNWDYGGGEGANWGRNGNGGGFGGGDPSLDPPSTSSSSGGSWRDWAAASDAEMRGINNAIDSVRDAFGGGSSSGEYEDSGGDVY